MNFHWNAALWKRSWAEGWLLLVCCAAILFLFSWIRVWIVSQLEMSSIRNILDSLPESWLRFSPVPLSQLFTYEGRVAITYEEPIVYLLMATWAIARASDCVSGGLERGTLELLLAQPVSRLQVYGCQIGVAICGIAILSGVAHVGTATGIRTAEVKVESPPVKIPILDIPVPMTGGSIVQEPMSKYVQSSMFLPATLNYFAFGFFLLGITACLSSWDRYRRRTIGIAVGFYVIQAIFELIGMAMDGFHWMKYVTFFAVYEPVRFVSETAHHPELTWSIWISGQAGKPGTLGPLGADLVLIGLGLFGLIVGSIVFCRRDLPAPL